MVSTRIHAATRLTKLCVKTIFRIWDLVDSPTICYRKYFELGELRQNCFYFSQIYNIVARKFSQKVLSQRYNARYKIKSMSNYCSS